MLFPSRAGRPSCCSRSPTRGFWITSSASPHCFLGLSFDPIVDQLCARVLANSTAYRERRPMLSLGAFDRDVLEGSRICEPRNQAEPGFSNPPPDAVDKGELHQRRIDCPFGHQLLHLVQDRRTLLVVELSGLLLKERVDLGVAAIGVGPTLDDKRGEPRCGAAEGGAGGLDDPLLELLVRVPFEEGGPLERPQLGTDAHCQEVVEHRLTKI